MIKINQQRCDLCGTCISVCPQQCIDIVHFNLLINHSACIRCNNCLAVCPIHALAMEEHDA